MSELGSVKGAGSALPAPRVKRVGLLWKQMTIFSERHNGRLSLHTRSGRTSMISPRKKLPSALRSSKPKSPASRRREEPNRRLSAPPVHFLNLTGRAEAIAILSKPPGRKDEPRH